jgi:CelD/BcsL family acetyltransferase involved in cellulose biosynthesis
MSPDPDSPQEPIENRCCILTSSEQLLRIRPQWEALWSRSSAEYVLSFASIYQSWNIIHRPRGAALCCAILTDGTGLYAVLPLVIYRRRLWRTASTCGPRAAEPPDVLVDDGPESAALARTLLLNALRLSRPDLLEFELVRVGSHLELALRSISPARYIDTWEMEIPYARLRAEIDWPSYRRSLGNRYQNQCARLMRRLKEQGSVSVEILKGQATPLIDWLFVHKRRWAERTQRRADWVFSDSYRKYLEVLFSSDPRYLIFTLKLNGAPIAVKLVAINPTSASLVIITYDGDYRRFSPGNLLDEPMMQHIFENYRSRDGHPLDLTFGPGVENYKIHWSRGNLQKARSYRIVTSRWGAAGQRLKRVLTAMTRR